MTGWYRKYRQDLVMYLMTKRVASTNIKIFVTFDAQCCTVEHITNVSYFFHFLFNNKTQFKTLFFFNKYILSLFQVFKDS